MRIKSEEERKQTKKLIQVQRLKRKKPGLERKEQQAARARKSGI